MSTFTPRRSIGRTGFVATQVGQGDLADRSQPKEKLVALLRRALDAGINVLDTAPAYEHGFSEELVGEAVRGFGRREAVFVIDKVDELQAPVLPQVDASLARLGLDHADLFALHNLSTMELWDASVAPGGALEQLDDAVRAGKARFRGISSHHPDVLRAALKSGRCDVVMFPVGPFVDRRYVSEILPLAKSKGVGTVAFKTFGGGKLVADSTGYNQPLPGASSVPAVPRLPHLGIGECVRYTLTRDPDVALLGLSSAEEQDAAFAAVRDAVPLAPEQLKELERYASDAVQGKGPCWWNPDPYAKD